MKKLKICLVNYEQALGLDAILTKYARMMERELIDMGHEVIVQPTIKDGYINHHINFVAYVNQKKGKHTTMITHVSGDKTWTEEFKLRLVKNQESWGTIGFPMNEGMKETLIQAGCDPKKLFVTGHAHDSLPRRPILITISSNLYPDGRKREEMFTELVKQLPNQNQFIFRIMGKDWMRVLEPLRKIGIQVQWTDHFTADLYNQLLSTSDYLLYTGGEDSLAQSVIDAKQAGLRIIAPPNKDLAVELPFTNQEELNEIFRKLVENPVKEWTWENFTKRHVAVWEKM